MADNTFLDNLMSPVYGPTEPPDRSFSYTKPYPKPKTTEEVVENLSVINKAISAKSAELSAADRAAFKDKQKELQDLYQKNEDRVRTGELIESFGQAFAKLGAGLHGLKTGVDMSGVKFDKTNWESAYDRAINKLKINISALQQQEEEARQSVNKEAEAAREGATKEAELGIRGIEAEKQRQAQQAIVHEQTAARKATAAAEAAANKEKAEDAFWLKLNDKLSQAKTDEAKETAIDQIKGDLVGEGYFTKEELEQKFSAPRWFDFLGRRQLEPNEVAALIGTLRQEAQAKPTHTPVAPTNVTPPTTIRDQLKAQLTIQFPHRSEKDIEDTLDKKFGPKRQ